MISDKFDQTIKKKSVFLIITFPRSFNLIILKSVKNKFSLLKVEKSDLPLMIFNISINLGLTI